MSKKPGPGRPRKSEGEKAARVTITSDARQLLDDLIVLQQDFRLQLGLADGKFVQPPPERLRNAMLSKLIADEHERATCGKIRIIAPMAGHSEHYDEASKWLKEQEAALEAAAPQGIKNGLGVSRDMLRKKSDG